MSGFVTEKKKIFLFFLLSIDDWNLVYSNTNSNQISKEGEKVLDFILRLISDTIEINRSWSPVTQMVTLCVEFNCSLYLYWSCFNW